MRYVLDASAIVEHLEDRAGARKVEALLMAAKGGMAEIFVSVVNWGEAFHSFWQRRGYEETSTVFARLLRTPIAVVDATRQSAEGAAAIKAQFAVPYADGFAVQLALEKKARLVTADSDLERVKDRVKLVRLR
jgi:predicted nucleic acid-binding protein